MTETTNETAIVSAPLVQNSIYSVNGAVYIAIDTETLVGITDNARRFKANGTEELLHSVGSQDWITRMIQVRSNLAVNLFSAQENAKQQSEYITNLGQAILEKAIDHDWCEEYDEFAEEWDLPQRRQEYDVVVSVRVLAKDSEAAELFVADNFSLSGYDDNVVTGPEFSSDRVY